MLRYKTMWRLAIALLCCPVLPAACNCVTQPQSRARSQAFVIFEGVVTGIEHVDPPKAASDRTLVTFSVSRKWKGAVGKEVKVHAAQRALLCDSYTFETGQRYIVYAVRIDKESGWNDKYPAGTKIISVGDCILRIRKDIAEESKRLGKSQTRISSFETVPATP
jgi:hypothetical protein